MCDPPSNALTVDVEDYYHVSAFESVIAPGTWDELESRVEANTRRVLDLLAGYALAGTFFVLGWVAKRHPGLVRSIQAAGHEIACHGYQHRRILFQTPEIFRRDVSSAKSLLEDITGQPVRGYRAPSYSITPATAWALDILIEEGFAYDSSVFPIVHDLYGFPGAPPYPYCIARPGGTLLEFPPTTLRLNLLVRSMALPIAGGGYLRLFPGWFTRWGLRRLARDEGRPCAVYFHPWEIDPGQPRIKAGWKSRFRHYYNLAKMERRLRDLFENMAFAPMGTVLAALEPLPVVSLGPPPPPSRHS